MVKIGVIVSRGFEKVAVSQIREIVEKPKEITSDETFVYFNCAKIEDAFRFVYRNQIASRVVYFIDKIDYSDDEDLLEKTREQFKMLDDGFLKEMMSGGIDFRTSVRTDEHTDVTYLESELGGILIEYAKLQGYGLKVNLKNPILNFYVHINNDTAYLGIDLSGELSKRDYKIFNNSVSLKGTTAFGLLSIAGYKTKDVYVNPMCYSGTLEIEAALYATKTSHRYYNRSFPFMRFPQFIDDDWEKFFKSIDSERILEKSDISITGSDKLLSSITAAVKNAKIAGVESFINFRRIDVDWADIKYEEKSIDKIISFIKGSSKRDKDILKEFKELFYQAEYILKDSGAIVIMCLSKDLLIEASKEYFDLDKETVVHSGSSSMPVLFFKKK